jgi:predicted DNA-binding WGR domain protein
MSRRDFHFISGASSKFWAIEMNGDSFDVTYGKIGTQGTTQTKSFADATASKKAYDKLVLEKTSKGYVEIGGGASSTKAETKLAGKAEKADGVASPTGLNELYFSTTQNVSDIGNLKTFVGHKIADYKSKKSIKKGNYVYKIGVSYEDEDEEGEGSCDFNQRLIDYLDSDAATTAQGLVIGNWSLDGPESCKPIVETLISKKDRLPSLSALFFGEIGQEENEISWIENCDMTPLLAAFPKLELFRVRGATNLEFIKAKHKTLRALGVESGGLAREVVAQICKADFPNLEYLELWLGTDSYGGTTQVSDLTPIMKGTAFPKLKYLGLRNSEITDDIAGVIINSPIIRQIETLDLSLGTLSDLGAKALMKLPQDAKLKRLDLHRHFLSTAMMKQLKTLPFSLNLSEQETVDDDEGGRFVAVSE